MDTEENKKKIVRRSERTPKPKRKKGVNYITEDTIKATSKTAEKTSIGKANPSTSQPSVSATNKVCKKQALRKKPKKLGLFVIDCEEIVGAKKINIDAFKTFLQEKIKVAGKLKDERVKIESQEMKVVINADVYIEKTYIKYLIKKYLKANKLNNWMKVVNARKSYLLKYFHSQQNNLQS